MKNLEKLTNENITAEQFISVMSDDHNELDCLNFLKKLILKEVEQEISDNHKNYFIWKLK